MQNCLKPKLFIDLRIFFLVYSSCVTSYCLNNELLISSTGTSWIALFILFLVSYDLRIVLIPSFTHPICSFLISTWGALLFWLFSALSLLKPNLTCAIISALISGPPFLWFVPCTHLVHRESFLLSYPIHSEQSTSFWKTSRKPALLVFAYWSFFIQIVNPFSCKYCFASHWTSSHLAACTILPSIHDVPPLSHYDTPFKYCLIFIILVGTCMPVVMGSNYESSSKGGILIL